MRAVQVIDGRGSRCHVQRTTGKWRGSIVAGYMQGDEDTSNPNFIQDERALPQIPPRFVWLSELFSRRQVQLSTALAHNKKEDEQA